MANIYDAEYTSVWDDDVMIVSAVTVDLDKMMIIEFGERWLDGNCDSYDIDTIDDEVEILKEEYLYVPELACSYAVCSEGNWQDFDDPDDVYGNGVVLY